MKKILVVGCGLSGVTIARQLAENNFKVDIIDRRNHIAGNCYDYVSKLGIRVHKYGPHIFHTKNKKIVNWLSQFTNWAHYEHKVKAMMKDGSLVTFPPNKKTKEIVGENNIFDVFYKPYSEKMWGVKVESLAPGITARVPIRSDDEDRYFPNDTFQLMPTNGYTQLVKNIIDHENINVYLSTAFTKDYERDYDHVFNSMPIDEYYDYLYGELPYRSIKFANRILDIPQLFPVATVNFTHTGKYTRVTEWKHFPNHGSSDEKSIVTFEQPCDYKENNFERYYPVKDANNVNRNKYNKYAKIKNCNTTFIGRCGLYVYIDMDQAVAISLATSKKFIISQK